MTSTNRTPKARSRHAKPDPNTCPYCGSVGELREVANRVTWQPVKLAYTADDDAIPAPYEYEHFETGDETADERYECASCLGEWETLAALAHDQRIVQALAEHAEHWRDRSDRIDQLMQAGRGGEDAAEDLGYAVGAAHAYERALRIFQGNGEA